MPDYHHDDNGNLQPADIHETTPQELRQRFVDEFGSSARRPLVYAGWLRYVAEFSTEVGTDFRQWIAGSFITKKEEPGDIDVVNFVPADRCTIAVDRFLTDFGSKQRWNVDGYYVKVYPEGHPYYELTRRDTAYFLNLFSHDRRGNKKGILTIEHGNGTI